MTQNALPVRFSILATSRSLQPPPTKTGGAIWLNAKFDGNGKYKSFSQVKAKGEFSLLKAARARREKEKAEKRFLCAQAGDNHMYVEPSLSRIIATRPHSSMCSSRPGDYLLRPPRTVCFLLGGCGNKRHYQTIRPEGGFPSFWFSPPRYYSKSGGTTKTPSFSRCSVFPLVFSRFQAKKTAK